ncbi:unnamed protein product [Pedinophyceae sp. YPF-701]|nr:unnamed protein product [Pedinophyceae sp. YPF-701]
MRVGRRALLGALGMPAVLPRPAQAEELYAWGLVKGDGGMEQGSLASQALSRKVSGPLASAMGSAVYGAVQDLGLASEEQFQARATRLRLREYGYYYEANKDKLPVVPDLADGTGGQSNPTFLNFSLYVTWKAAFGLVQTSSERERLVRTAGVKFADLCLPDARATLRASAEANGGRAKPEVVKTEVGKLLTALEEGNYVLGSSAIWGTTPSVGNPQADGRGYMPSTSIDIGGDAVLPGVTGLAPGEVFQVRLLRPADIEGAVSLRAEEDGDWGHLVSASVAALLEAGGIKADVDEYFFQDSWEPPRTLWEKVLLFFGDPLFQVQVPWTPTSLIQDWVVTA